MSWLSSAVDRNARFFNGISDRVGLTNIKLGLNNGDPQLITNGLRTLTSGPYPDLAKDPVRDNIVKANSSYSGTDCYAVAQVNEKLVLLGNVSTFSYSVFREKVPVRVLGRSHAKAYTAGGRTIAGSIIFIVFDRSPLYDLLKLFTHTNNPSDRYTSPLPDQMPPIDLMLVFGNEYGHTSVLKLYGVEIAQENQVHSINDLYSENTMQYVARDMDVLINSKEIGSFKDLIFERQLAGQFTDNLLGSMLEYRRSIDSKIAEQDVLIGRIYTEMGRKNIVTLGISALGGNQDLKMQLDLAVKKKSLWVAELKRVDGEIKKHETRGYNAQNGIDGSMSKDNLKANPTDQQTNPSIINYDSTFPKAQSSTKAEEEWKNWQEGK